MQQVKNQAAQVNAQRASQLAQAAAASSNDTTRADPDHLMQDVSGEAGGSKPIAPGQVPMSLDSPQKHPDSRMVPNAAQPFPHRQAWDYVEEVMQILKTAFPLLIMNMETVVEQIILRFKASPEEEIYRLICMLLQDAMQVCSCLSCVKRIILN